MIELEITTNLRPSDVFAAASEVAETGLIAAISRSGVPYLVLQDGTEPQPFLTAIEVYETAGRSVEDKRPKIYRYTDDAIGALPHKDINFKTQLDRRLHPSYEFRNGVLLKTFYYAEAVTDPFTLQQTFSDLVVRVDDVYARQGGPDNDISFAYGRTKTITWINEDDTDNNDPKIKQKGYNDRTAQEEQARRRANVISNLESALAKILIGGLQVPNAIEEARSIRSELTLVVAEFLSSGDTVPVHSAVAADSTRPWLDLSGFLPFAPTLTVRQFIIGSIV